MPSYLTDLHCHLLPGVDHGAWTWSRPLAGHTTTTTGRAQASHPPL